MDAPILQPAYVLHTRRYGDSSLLVELLTRGQGRQAAIAKGALRARRPDAGIRPFQPLLVELRGRGEVLTVVRAESAGPPAALSGRALYCGLYLNELLLRLTARQDASTGLFDDYARALAGLAGPLPTEPVLRRFEVRLLGHLGLGLALDQDNLGQPIRPSASYTYTAESGAVPCSRGSADAVGGSTLLALRSGEFPDEECLAEARTLMRRILHHHLDGRPLRSRELFR